MDPCFQLVIMDLQCIFMFFCLTDHSTSKFRVITGPSPHRTTRVCLPRPNRSKASKSDTSNIPAPASHGPLHACMYVYIYIYVCMYIYIYVYVCIIYIYTYICIIYVYIYNIIKQNTYIKGIKCPHVYVYICIYIIKITWNIMMYQYDIASLLLTARP